MSSRVIDIAGKSLSLANLEKDLYPAYGFTKAQILEYYRKMAPVILPHLQGRALTLKRYPEGVDQDYFFEKRCPAHRPAWVPTARLSLEDGEEMTVCLVNNLETLMWVENLASLELHVPLAKVASPGTPDAIVFDLDPGEPAALGECARVALILRDLFTQSGAGQLCQNLGPERAPRFSAFASSRHHLRGHQTIFQGGGRDHAKELPGISNRQNGQGAKAGQGLHQLVAKRPRQDHGGRVFPQGQGKADGLLPRNLDGS